MDKVGLLLINLGTPDSPRTPDVRRYLREFLSDPRVLDVPAWKRTLVLNLFILPFRPKQSGEAYEQIWTDRGSPLMIHTEELTSKVRARLGERVITDFAMRYGSPSIPAVLENMRRRGVDRLVVFPLYPQYSSAATGSSLERVYEIVAKLWNTPYLQIVPPFFDHPDYIRCSADLARPYVERVDPELVFFSFHGLPERQVRKSDDTGAHCLCRDDCCDAMVEANRNCYRAQCFANARLLADALGIPESKRRVCFQSRLGRDPWIRPYTDVMLEQEAKRGVKRALILSPAFVADCLETLEELGIRASETWRENGGETLELVPCLNSGDAWAEAVASIARQQASWLREPSRTAASAGVEQPA